MATDEGDTPVLVLGGNAYRAVPMPGVSLQGKPVYVLEHAPVFINGTPDYAHWSAVDWMTNPEPGYDLHHVLRGLETITAAIK